MTTLFDPINLGSLTLPNRIVMAPLTRNRATPDGVPTAMMVEYYRQRAEAGLIIAEASQISPMGKGYIDTPGIYNAEQVAGWRKVTDAVHEAGGRIVIQLWHVGRISHTSLLPDSAAPVSSTDRRANGMSFTRQGFEQTSTPRALRDDEIPALIADYRNAARCAIEAGFDGVEIHSANTYLLEQFLRDSVNDRRGPYGGSIENRARLVLEVTQAVCEEIGAERTGIRLSPGTTFNDTARDSQAQALYGHVVEQLAPLGLAYLHVIEGETGGQRRPADEQPAFDYAALRRAFPGPWMVNNGLDRAEGARMLAAGETDLVCFGRDFISNPDLVRRLRENAPLNELDKDTMYGGDERGYTDYPTLDEVHSDA